MNAAAHKVSQINFDVERHKCPGAAQAGVCLHSEAPSQGQGIQLAVQAQPFSHLGLPCSGVMLGSWLAGSLQVTSRATSRDEEPARLKAEQLSGGECNHVCSIGQVWAT